MVVSKFPKSLNDCVATDYTAQNLWLWGGRINKCGVVLFVFMIIIGIAFAISASLRTEITGTYYLREETVFDLEIFLTTALTWAVYILIEFCVYHFLSLLLYALGNIVENTKISANIALFEAQQNNTASRDSSAPHQQTVDNFTSWRCKKCDTLNAPTEMFCKQCGEYK